MNRIAILMTCHNRREKTLRCLSHLHESILPSKYIFDVYLTDDGCTDGTGEAVLKAYPKVTVLQGDGNLFWNRGMYKAWQAAALKDYEYYMWLNDDTYLYPSSLSTLIECSEKYDNHCIIVGNTCSSDDENKITYGGKKKEKSMKAASYPQECDSFEGNIVLIPQYVYQKVGTNDPVFSHAMGDSDYGKRASKLGVKSVLASGILGVCDEHGDFSAWCNPKTPLLKRLKLLYTPLGNNPNEYFIYESRHHGYIKAGFHYITIHLRAIFPKIWVKFK